MPDQQLFTALLQNLYLNGPDSPQVQGILQEIKEKDADHYPQAQATVNVWRMSQGAPAQAMPQSLLGDGGSLWKQAAALLAVFGLGGGAGAGVSQVSLDKIPQMLTSIPLPLVTDRATLMMYVAATGALVGLLHSLYYNKWTLVLPQFFKQSSHFQVASWGFLRNVAAAVSTAVATTWVAFSGTAVPAKTAEQPAAPAPATPGAAPLAAATGGTPSDKPKDKDDQKPNSSNEKEKKPESAPKENSLAATAPTKEPENLLTWTVLLSAATAGFVGSRMSSNAVDKKILMEALPQAAANAGSSAVGAAVSAAPTVAAMAATATGNAVPGFTPPKNLDLVRQETAAQAELLSLFDAPTLRDILTKLGKPLASDGTGLSLAALARVQLLKPVIRDILKDLDITVVGALPDSDAFVALIGDGGLEVTPGLKTTLIEIHKQAQRSRQLLSQMPAGWTLAPDKI